MNEARLRQRSLLQELDGVLLPKEIEEKAFELLVELLLAVVPALEGGRGDEQDHR
ncbi:MAG: hypothetical protein ACREUT_00270 [Steroidobacteraceae bacterium]